VRQWLQDTVKYLKANPLPSGLAAVLAMDVPAHTMSMLPETMVNLDTELATFGLGNIRAKAAGAWRLSRWAVTRSAFCAAWKTEEPVTSAAALLAWSEFAAAQASLSQWLEAHADRLADLGAPMELFPAPLDIDMTIAPATRWGAAICPAVVLSMDVQLKAACAAVVDKCPKDEVLAML
jgi:hypothetical protein